MCTTTITMRKTRAAHSHQPRWRRFAPYALSASGPPKIRRLPRRWLMMNPTSTRPETAISAFLPIDERSQLIHIPGWVGNPRGTEGAAPLRTFIAAAAVAQAARLQAGKGQLHRHGAGYTDDLGFAHRS